jgi:hypothetical protein
VSYWLGQAKTSTTDVYVNGNAKLSHDLNARPMLALVSNG